MSSMVRHPPAVIDMPAELHRRHLAALFGLPLTAIDHSVCGHKGGKEIARQGERVGSVTREHHGAPSGRNAFEMQKQ